MHRRRAYLHLQAKLIINSDSIIVLVCARREVSSAPKRTMPRRMYIYVRVAHHHRHHSLHVHVKNGLTPLCYNIFLIFHEIVTKLLNQKR